MLNAILKLFQRRVPEHSPEKRDPRVLDSLDLQTLADLPPYHPLCEPKLTAVAHDRTCMGC